MTHTPIHHSSVSSLPNYNVLCLLPRREAHILPTPSPGIATLTPHKRGSPNFVVYGAPRSDSKPPFPASPPALHLLTLLPLPSSFRHTPWHFRNHAPCFPASRSLGSAVPFTRTAVSSPGRCYSSVTPFRSLHPTVTQAKRAVSSFVC